MSLYFLQINWTHQAGAVRLRFTLVTASLVLTVTTIHASPAPVSFRRDILPLFAKECAYCHSKEAPDAGLILEMRFAYAMIVDVPSSESPLKRVSAGHPAESYLLLKMHNRQRDSGGGGRKMPPWGFASPAEIDLVRAWIAAGGRRINEEARRAFTA